MSGLTITNIYKSFEGKRVLQGISFRVPVGKITALLGPSGCGKSTLLEIIAGLIKPDRGECTWNEESLTGVAPHKRGFGLMFQDYALFPHKNVGENVAFGLKMADWEKENIKQRTEKVLDLVGLPAYGSRDVSTLSGGEQQRVALARSLAPQPRLLMLDEPLGSLDRTLRERLMGELREILSDMGQTVLYVTHDQVEAFTVADQVVVMKAGAVAQIGTPQLIYQHPDSPFVARFLGLDNLLSGQVRKTKTGTMVSTALGDWPVSHPREGQVTVLLRPDRFQVGPVASHHLTGTLIQCNFSGNMYQIAVDVQGTILHVDFPASTTELPPEGETITLSFDSHVAAQILTDNIKEN